jgi:hypothetical protein
VGKGPAGGDRLGFAFIASPRARARVIVRLEVKLRVVRRAWRAGAFGLLLPCACEVHGLVGSNASTLGVGTTGSAGDSGDEGIDSGGGTSSTGTPWGSGGSTRGLDDSSEGATTEAVVFDVGPGDGPEVCLAPLPTTCDQGSEDLWHAMGVGCPGSVQALTSFSGHVGALHVHRGLLGTHGEYAPREGERMVILSTGRAADVPRTHAEIGCNPETCPSTAFDASSPMFTLPPPLTMTQVDDKLTCVEDPELVGTGDCSNTLQDEWSAGAGAYDYAELRMSTKVPEGADAFTYQFAFFSAEYPMGADHGVLFNDMYVAWLESEAWTGNISFDELGNPISIHGVFLDYLDADSPLCERIPCEAPELDGFAMDGHAGTRWLETIAPVVSGEQIEVIFAIFDLTDALFDTVVVLDAARWGCTDLPPLTQPQG